MGESNPGHHAAPEGVGVSVEELPKTVVPLTLEDGTKTELTTVMW